MNEFSSKLDIAEEGNSELEVSSEEIIQNVACTEGIKITDENKKHIDQSKKVLHTFIWSPRQRREREWGRADGRHRSID